MFNHDASANNIRSIYGNNKNDLCVNDTSDDMTISKNSSKHISTVKIIWVIMMTIISQHIYGIYDNDFSAKIKIFLIGIPIFDLAIQIIFSKLSEMCFIIVSVNISQPILW